MIKSWVLDPKKSPDVLHFSNLASIPEVIERLNYFRSLSAAGLDNLTKSQLATLQSEILQYFNATHYGISQLPKGFLLYRATVNKRITGLNEHYLTKVSQLIGPPKSALKRLGRGNGLAIPAFYGASSFKVALFEAFPEPDDCITVSAWKLRPNKVFNFAQIFHPDVSRKTPNYASIRDQYLKAARADHPLLSHIRGENEKFLTEEFMKDIKGRSDANYIFTSTFAEQTFQNRRSDNNPISGIVYPSTKIRDGNFNLVMPNSIIHEYFELVELAFLEVKEIIDSDVDFRDNEVIGHNTIRTSQSFDVAKDKILLNGDLDLKYMPM